MSFLSRFFIKRTSSFSCVALAAAVLWGGVCFSDAQARPHQKPSATQSSGRSHRGGVYTPPKSALVVDAYTGRYLFVDNPNALRHPASITKILTLYLTFEALEKGRVTLDTRMPVSPYAASRSPSKLGLRVGSSLSVRDAIYALITKSANDAASTLAEYLGGGSEPRFAQMMTQKARFIGMSSSTFVNPSGLPDDRQITTAHDMAILAVRLMKDYPQYYRLFSTRQFVYQGRNIPNHNRLLGNYEGTDGIKTGYTDKSGFNLVASAKRGGTRLIGVVFGGNSGGSRDQYMRKILDEGFNAVGRGVALNDTLEVSLGNENTLVATSFQDPNAAAWRAPEPAPRAWTQSDEVSQQDDEEGEDGSSKNSMNGSVNPSVNPSVKAEATPVPPVAEQWGNAPHNTTPIQTQNNNGVQSASTTGIKDPQSVQPSGKEGSLVRLSSLTVLPPPAPPASRNNPPPSNKSQGGGWTVQQPSSSDPESSSSSVKEAQNLSNGTGSVVPSANKSPVKEGASQTMPQNGISFQPKGQGTTTLQLGKFQTEDAAQNYLKTLKDRFSQILVNKSPKITTSQDGTVTLSVTGYTPDDSKEICRLFILQQRTCKILSAQ
jgi:D-alanyl-D-alanine carboxypeptidase